MQCSQKVTVTVTIHDLIARRWLRGVGGEWHLRHLRLNLRVKSWKICHQFSIYGWTLGGTVKFEFEFAYKLHVAVQQKSLFTLKISVLSYRLYMNPQVYTDLVTSSVFEKLLEDTQHFILSTMSRLGEITSTGGIITSKGAALEVMSMEVPAIVLMVPR